MKTTAMERLTDSLYRFWRWLMEVFAAEDGEEQYDDDSAWDDWETETL